MPATQPRVAARELSTVKLSKEELLRAYRTMLVARRADEKILIMLKQGKCFFHIGGSGHEAAQVAAAAALRPNHDWGFPYYRDMAFALHMGMTIEDIFLSALHRAEDPTTGGRQPQGHYGRPDIRIPTQSSPTGTQYLQAVGVAMACKKERTDEVVYVSSGEGATSEGEFFEAVNWAARDAYPVIFSFRTTAMQYRFRWRTRLPAARCLKSSAVSRDWSDLMLMGRISPKSMLQCRKRSAGLVRVAVHP